MKRGFLLVALFLQSSVFLFPQNNQVTFAAGGGALVAPKETLGTSAFTLSYSRDLPLRLAIEGSLDFFFVRNDDFSGAAVSVLYHLSDPRSGRLVPYVGAGIGKTTTDFTEIQAQNLVRMLAGIKYDISDNWDLRVEARDEIMEGSSYLVEAGSRVHFPSVRFGISRRF